MAGSVFNHLSLGVLVVFAQEAYVCAPPESRTEPLQLHDLCEGARY